MIADRPDPHAGQPVLTRGRSLSEAKAAMIMIHGRGATAESILSMVPAFNRGDLAYLAPQAQGNTWYPFSFLNPIPQNEPGISSGMRSIERVLKTITDAGIPVEKTLLLGFSQGACLTTEFVARHARRYGGVAGLSGGLIGPDGTPRNYSGSLQDTPVFLGCSDVDSHIPAARVRESAEILTRLGARVTTRLYPGMGHLVNEDEIEFVRTMIDAVLVGGQLHRA
jgi:predicted esterase